MFESSSLFLNPVVISVVVMIVLCLLKLNVFFALLISALVAGVTAGMTPVKSISILVGGMSGNAETALSYILLGTFAIALGKTGLASILSKSISKVIGNKKVILVLFIAGIACFSQNIVPVHIAFIPILIPPLLKLMNHLKLDRRAMACALTFGVKAPYIALPFGYGLIFHGILADEITRNGMEVAKNDVYKTTWILGLAMVTGLFIAVFITYRKDREYQDLPLKGIQEVVSEKMEQKHWLTILATILAFVVQFFTSSLILGALAALALMILTGVIKWNDLTEYLEEGIGIMGMIAFIMLVASGYGTIIRETNAIEPLIDGIINSIGGSVLIGSFAMLLVGLLITMGIGTSFGTIPVVATIYIPLCLRLGISPAGAIVLLAAAGALGDAGSPASDSTLGPTAGLNVDGQHDHIRDTCIPTFLHYNIPLIAAGMIGAMIF